ncbi:MAG TPA: Clp protease N-terminal domain-containing protein, partial [Acidimicrobiales bacterium]|nr:Clp protease N-terminal domain-containing protein [Acidimicrobiales bacterium]
MFEAFSARGRSVVERAHDESHRLGHPHVGTEHLLLGVLVAEDGAAPAVLGAAGVGVNACRRKVAEAVA